MEDQPLSTSLFISLVYSLNLTALQQLGVARNPFTGNKEIDIESARVTLDLLQMLVTKTKNNLNPDEDHFLQDILSQLEQIIEQKPQP